MTHAELVRLACRWLRRRGCNVVLAEITTAESETPDAIGWGSHRRSHVVECKTSLADLRRDARKPHRMLGRGMGAQRWILAPRGVLRVEHIPLDHGLLETDGRRVFVVIEGPRRDPTRRDTIAELEVMRSALQRHQVGARWFASDFRFEPYAERRRREDR